MKKLFYILVSVLLLTSCAEEPKLVKGYLVHKTEIKSHMSNEKPVEVNYAGFTLGSYHPVHPITHPHLYNTRHRTKSKPKLVESRYIFYIGNKDGVVDIDVNKEVFNNYKCGDKISLTKKL